MANPKLAGSAIYPDPIELAEGQTIAPETLVTAAFAASELDAKDWNKLTDAERDEYLGLTLADLQEAASEGKLPEGIQTLEAGAEDEPQAEDPSAGDKSADGDSKNKNKPKAASKAKAARGEEIPEWQKPDYSGALHGGQAEHRNKHLTHHRIAGTGPYAETKGKK